MLNGTGAQVVGSRREPLHRLYPHRAIRPRERLARQVARLERPRLHRRAGSPRAHHPAALGAVPADVAHRYGGPVARKRQAADWQCFNPVADRSSRLRQDALLQDSAAARTARLLQRQDKLQERVRPEYRPHDVCPHQHRRVRQDHLLTADCTEIPAVVG